MTELIAAVLAVLIYRLGVYDAGVKTKKKKSENGYDVLMANIERYDGTADGQKEIRNS
ncbi:MAG: hypothetical protein IKJ17_03845 [Clostridia bacterium]|nr:hypothetical protein [Clostridia bacterium]